MSVGAGSGAWLWLCARGGFRLSGSASSLHHIIIITFTTTCDNMLFNIDSRRSASTSPCAQPLCENIAWRKLGARVGASQDSKVPQSSRVICISHICTSISTWLRQPRRSSTLIPLLIYIPTHTSTIILHIPLLLPQLLILILLFLALVSENSIDVCVCVFSEKTIIYNVFGGWSSENTVFYSVFTHANSETSVMCGVFGWRITEHTVHGSVFTLSDALKTADQPAVMAPRRSRAEVGGPPPPSSLQVTCDISAEMPYRAVFAKIPLQTPP